MVKKKKVFKRQIWRERESGSYIVYTLMNCFHLLLSLPISFSVFFSGEGNSYVEDIEKRLERLESEKLELVKVCHRVTVNLHTFLNSQSLSAAHILAATNETESKDLPVCGIYLNAQVFSFQSGAALPEEIEIKEPPNIKDFLEHIKEQGKCRWKILTHQ